METKVCKGKYGCNKLLPLTAFRPYYDKRNKKSYLTNICKPCIRRKFRLQRNGFDGYNKGRFRTPPITRRCAKCKQVFLIIRFPTERTYTYKNGFSYKHHSYTCKTCLNKIKETKRYINLKDSYIRRNLVHGLKIKKEYITPDMIELKRAQIKLFREIKKQQNGNNNNRNHKESIEAT